MAAHKRKGVLALKRVRRYHSRSKKSNKSKALRLEQNYSLISSSEEFILVKRITGLVGLTERQRATFQVLRLAFRARPYLKITLNPSTAGMLKKLVHFVEIRKMV